MVEAGQDLKQTKLYPPNPDTFRGQRTQLSVSPDETFLAYCVQHSVILRNLKEPTKSFVYSDFLDKVTAVKYAPNGNLIATGDCKGRVKVWSFNTESREVFVKKEHQITQHPIMDIAWTDDSSRFVAVGQGQGVYSKAVNAETGSGVGEAIAASKTLYSVDIKKKPYKLAAGGENFHVFTQQAYRSSTKNRSLTNTPTS